MKKIFILGLGLSFLLIPILSHADSIVLSPAAFLPYSGSTIYQAGTSWLFVSSASLDSVFMAPVDLPDGVRITSIVVFYTDDSASGNVQITLFKVNIYTDVATSMANWISSSDSSAYQNHKISPIYGGLS